MGGRHAKRRGKGHDWIEAPEYCDLSGGAPPRRHSLHGLRTARHGPVQDDADAQAQRRPFLP